MIRLAAAALLAATTLTATAQAQVPSLNDLGRVLQNGIAPQQNPQGNRDAYEQGRRDAELQRRDEERRRYDDRPRADQDRYQRDRDRQEAERRRAYDEEQRGRGPAGRY